jgi:hypothetical protein
VANEDRIVKAKYANHVWHTDLTIVPTSLRKNGLFATGLQLPSTIFQEESWA